MYILILRHADAGDPRVFATSNPDDRQRPLSAKGRRRMVEIALGLRRVQPDLDLIFSSPLTRALQTAEILQQAFPKATREPAKELAPGGERKHLLKRLGKLPADSTLALIGHEPDLSELVAWLAAGSDFSFMELKKGAACLLKSVGKPGPASAELLWALAPKQLRQLGN